MDTNLILLGAAVVGAIALLIFVPTIRRIVRALFVTAIAVGSTAAAIFGVAVLMNNVSIYESPGASARILRFLTVNWAATSDKGLGAKTCEAGTAPGRAPAVKPTPAVPRAKTAGQPAPSPTATPAVPEQEDVYPELVQRGYPGISRARLFKLAEEAVNELGGWKIVKNDPRNYTLDCVYTTRVFRFEDDVKIVVTPRSEISLCSRSRTGEGQPGFPGLLFGGDFGANIGHIKEFYTAMEPKVDAVYKEEEKKQNAPRK